MVGRSIRKLFVEGGGDSSESLRTECRRGFRKLLEKAGLKGRMPRIVPCGGRRNAYEQFCTALANGETDSVLLVDAESKVVRESQWRHIAEREADGWRKPPQATDEHLHFMTECMESWFLSDKSALSRFFGNGFNVKALPANPDIEQVPKRDVLRGLETASKNTTKGVYGKGAHSFKILAEIDPEKLRDSAPGAAKLLKHLKETY